jgi:hypothetical protein
MLTDDIVRPRGLLIELFGRPANTYFGAKRRGYNNMSAIAGALNRNWQAWRGAMGVPNTANEFREFVANSYPALLQTVLPVLKGMGGDPPGVAAQPDVAGATSTPKTGAPVPPPITLPGQPSQRGRPRATPASASVSPAGTPANVAPGSAAAAGQPAPGSAAGTPAAPGSSAAPAKPAAGSAASDQTTAGSTNTAQPQAVPGAAAAATSSNRPATATAPPTATPEPLGAAQTATAAPSTASPTTTPEPPEAAQTAAAAPTGQAAPASDAGPHIQTAMAQLGNLFRQPQTDPAAVMQTIATSLQQAKTPQDRQQVKDMIGQLRARPDLVKKVPQLATILPESRRLVREDAALSRQQLANLCTVMAREMMKTASAARAGGQARTAQPVQPAQAQPAQADPANTGNVNSGKVITKANWDAALAALSNKTQAPLQRRELAAFERVFKIYPNGLPLAQFRQAAGTFQWSKEANAVVSLALRQKSTTAA